MKQQGVQERLLGVTLEQGSESARAFWAGEIATAKAPRQPGLEQRDRDGSRQCGQRGEGSDALRPCKFL